MKRRILTILLLFFVTTQVTFSVEENFGKYFIYKKETHNYVFKELDKDSVDKMSNADLEEYKKAFRLNKLYLKDKHLKIVHKNPDFIPSLYALYYKNYDSKNYNLAIDYLNKINPELVVDILTKK